MLKTIPHLFYRRSCRSAILSLLDISVQTPTFPRYHRHFSKHLKLKDATAQPSIPLSSVDSAASTIPQRRLRTSRRYVRNSIYATVFLLLGLTTGKVVSAVLVPPPLPMPDTDEEAALLSNLRKDLANLPLVQELRAQRDEWLEYEAYMSDPPDKKATHLVAGVMRGYKGLGVQRVFWNKRGSEDFKERRLICIIFFGGALAGWPGVTHGGAVATVMQECLERVLNGPGFGSQEEDEKAVLEDISVDYRKPTNANALFVIRAEIEEISDSGRVGVKARLENALTGVICAEASGHSLLKKGELPTTSIWDTATSVMRGLWS